MDVEFQVALAALPKVKSDRSLTVGAVTSGTMRRANPARTRNVPIA